MSFKKIFPYFLIFSACLSTSADRASLNTDNTKPNFSETKYNISYNTEIPYDTQEKTATAKADELINAYIDSAVSGTKRINQDKKKHGYHWAVQHELPGAPRNRACGTVHCLFAQYTQLNRALKHQGDTIQIIPKTYNAHQSSSAFKNQMKELYGNQKYPGAIRTGHLYPTRDQYNKALNNYLKTKMRGKNADTDSLRNKIIKDFEKHNFPTDSLTPGTIIIVNSGHAVMYLGQGKIKNKEFIPNPNGTAICCAYNNEYPAVELKTWNTSHAFTADIRKILVKRYSDQKAQEDALNFAHLIKNISTIIPNTHNDNTNVAKTYTFSDITKDNKPEPNLLMNIFEQNNNIKNKNLTSLFVKQY